MLKKLIAELKSNTNPKRAKDLQWYFKTGKGEYGEGDVFLGFTMEDQRQFAKKYSDLELIDIQKLLDSKFHEHRMIGLLILIGKYTKVEKKEKEKIFKFYLKNAKKINNWDLVDLSSPNIVGNFLLDKDKKILYELACSENLWERRISIVSTFAFIREGKLKETIKISKILLNDKHDLIHKAVGWALREVGKKDVKILENFLKTNYKKIPRTTLRYSIEKFEEKKRKKFLRGKFK